MDVLATRVLAYTTDEGEERDLPLFVYRPMDEGVAWKGGVVFGPPIDGKVVSVAGIDFIQALLGCLEVARGYLNGSPLSGRAHWHHMQHCGLPWHTDAPAPPHSMDAPPSEANPGDLVVLARRHLGSPDERGIEQDLVLTVFAPFESAVGSWKCAYAFGAGDRVHYGAGADFLEATLDSLAAARSVYEGMLPSGWSASETSDRLDCAGLPYKIGRAFWIDMVGDLGPEAPPHLRQSAW